MKELRKKLHILSLASMKLLCRGIHSQVIDRLVSSLKTFRQQLGPIDGDSNRILVVVVGGFGKKREEVCVGPVLTILTPHHHLAL